VREVAGYLLTPTALQHHTTLPLSGLMCYSRGIAGWRARDGCARHDALSAVGEAALPVYLLRP
jgi:hypothetical protein